MLKSISVWALKDNETRPAESLFAEARQHGFEAIELAVGLKGPVTLNTSREECEELVRLAGEHGLQICSLASGLGWQFPLSADDPVARQRAADVLRKSIEKAAWFGLRPLLVVPGTLAVGAVGRDHVPYDTAYERIRQGIADLAPFAERNGVVLGIENVWNRLLLSPIEMRDFIDGFRTDAVGAYLDVGNMIVSGYAEDWVRILGPRICAVHFKDFKRDVGNMSGFCDLLEGDVNYPAVMQALREVGYDGPCTAEFFQLDAEGLERVSKAMDEILAM